jgi:hypothetical protein
LARHGRPGDRVDLNDIAEVIAGRAVSYDEVEDIVTRLEARGLRVGDPLTIRDVDVIRSVIVSAHRLRERLDRSPTVDEIAADSGHPSHVVRRALEHGRAAATVRKQLTPGPTAERPPRDPSKNRSADPDRDPSRGRSADPDRDR